MPFEESLLQRLCSQLESFQDAFRRVVADGVITAGEIAALSAMLAALLAAAVYAEGCQRAGAWYVRVGRLPRDFAREHPDSALEAAD